MSAQIPAEQEQEIKSRMDIVEIIGHFEILRKKGKNYTSKCLFHTEKTPSFVVSPAKQIYKCYGCGVGGDAIKFLMEYDDLKLSYPDALRWLANFYNIHIDETTQQITNPLPRKPYTPKTSNKFREAVQVNLPADLLKRSIKYSRANSFIKYLDTLFERSIVNQLIDLYNIGSIDTPKWWGKDGGDNSAIFWFVNKIGAVRMGQVKHFQGNGHTSGYMKYDVKSSCTIPIHSYLELYYKNKNQPPPQWLKDYTTAHESNDLITCLFGEHLLSNPKYATRPIAIVEAPKTAIVASVFFPKYTWLAAGALTYLNVEKCEVLRGKDVVFFPDLGKIDNSERNLKKSGWDITKGKAFNEWKITAEQYTGFAGVKVSELLENIATEEQRAAGLDLCDYLETPEVRQELINSFKHEIINRCDNGEMSNTDHVGLWLEYCAKGLRLIDRRQAYRELIQCDGFVVCRTDRTEGGKVYPIECDNTAADTANYIKNLAA